MRSNGSAGEERAEIWFARRCWQMFKVAPPSRVAKIRGKAQIIYTGKGYPDYIGHVTAAVTSAHPHLPAQCAHHVRYCEVKEATAAEGDRMPASRLSRSQRDFMTALPEGAAYVAVLWRDSSFEVFPFVACGSYRRGEGIT